MKKKIFMITLAACLVVLSIAGTSLAYFTDTDAKTNVFTAGKVDITLTYDETTTRLYPGQEYIKDATINNVGTEDAYVGIIIEVPTTAFSLAEIEQVFTVPGNDTVKYVATATGYKIFAVAGAPIAKEAGAVVDSTTLSFKAKIPADWGNEKMATFNGLTIKVTAYGTQTVGFSNTTEALTKAFANDWAAAYTNP